MEVFSAGQELSDYAQDISGVIVDLLRRCYAGDASGAAAAVRAITGQDIPGWTREPPALPDD
ncbi:hypothetical protein [Actinomadura oligospora]|uniref:hypothetical protein n=1 Tax=Actinomadura oligospora TaxID=111804 RepID=UPI00047C1935|nr:hypothetical protein [Actinomadura oligospora]